MKRIPDILPPNRVHRQLIDEYGIGLFKFAQVFAVTPIDFIVQKSNKPFTFKAIKEIRLTLEKMLEDIFKAARKIEKLMNKAGGLPIKNKSDSELLKEEAIRKFWLEYILPHEMILFYFERTRQLGKRGIGLNKKSIVAVGWGNLAVKSGHRIDWKLLGDLYFWFWERIGQFDFYKEWLPTDGIEDYLKIQYHRYRFKGNLEDFVLEKLPTVEEGHEKDDLHFWMRLIIYKWADGKLTDKETSSLLLNISLDWFIAANEGLTILSPKASFADPFFGYLYLWLRSRVKKDLLFPPAEIKEFVEKFLTDKEPPFQGTDLGDYFLYASELYLAGHKDLKKLDPMIIFPDRSYFSPGL